jgi:chromosomal replication initiation ATPase DnaA
MVERKEEKTGKKVSIYLSHRYSGMKLKEIGELFCMSESGVTQASRRLEKKIEEDKKLKKKVKSTKSKLKL